MKVTEEARQCPVCRAAFRGTRHCSRCGADLEPLMLLMLSARRLRNVARAALVQGDSARARELAEDAQARCATEAGRHLVLLAEWLHEIEYAARRKRARS